MNTWLQRKNILTAPVANSSTTIRIGGDSSGHLMIAPSHSFHLHIGQAGGQFIVNNIDSRPILEKLIFPDASIAETARIEARRRKYKTLNERRRRKLKNVSDHYERSGVYLLYDDDYEVVYVGQSVRPFARISQHLKSKTFSHFRILWCLDSRKLHWERVLTRYFDPKLNKTNRPDHYRHA